MSFDVIKNALVSALNAADVAEYEIYYTSGTDNSIGTLNKEVNTFSSSTSGGLCLRLVMDGKMGYASTELMTEGEMVELVDRAIANASAASSGLGRLFRFNSRFVISITWCLSALP